jgi:hypothetical protein
MAQANFNSFPEMPAAPAPFVSLGIGEVIGAA